jgi:hypothetical protein
MRDVRIERAMGIEPTSEHWENFRYKFGTIQECRNKRWFP